MSQTLRGCPMLDQLHWTATAAYLLDLCIRIGLSVRVIKRRLPVGVALAWLSVILILPLAGAVQPPSVAVTTILPTVPVVATERLPEVSKNPPADVVVPGKFVVTPRTPNE